mmetsp:Transcript_93807/g.201414  ORF Transcript_93807/g.201414 Transcript_93807/m.201414 type:complete len:279 (+) Transcript_93807:436-1272(+)
MKPSKPLGCHVQSPKSKRTLFAKPSAAPSPVPSPSLARSSSSPPPGEAAKSCLRAPPTAAAPCRDFASGVQPVWREAKNFNEPGEGAWPPSTAGALVPCSTPSEAAGATVVTTSATGAASSAGGGTCKKSRPAPKLRALRKARRRCARRGPSLRGTLSRLASGTSCPALAVAAPATAAKRRLLFNGRELEAAAAPKARSWHSSAGRPTRAATCCQKCGVLGLTERNARWSVATSAGAQARPVSRRFEAACLRAPFRGNGGGNVASSALSKRGGGVRPA